MYFTRIVKLYWSIKLSGPSVCVAPEEKGAKCSLQLFQCVRCVFNQHWCKYKYRVGLKYQQIPNVKGLRSGLGPKKLDLPEAVLSRLTRITCALAQFSHNNNSLSRKLATIHKHKHMDDSYEQTLFLHPHGPSLKQGLDYRCTICTFRMIACVKIAEAAFFLSL